MEDNPVSGIYAILNMKNGKAYIGQAVDIKYRWRMHKNALNGGYHINPYLQRAWNKYGEESFAFNVVEECLMDQLNEREIHHIAMHRARGLCYNMTDGGDGTRGRIASNETRQKMSAAKKNMSEETRRKIGDARRGSILSDETRRKMSEAKKGTTFSDESRRKMSEANKRRPPITDETRRKLSEAKKGKRRAPFSDEARQRMSEAAKRRVARIGIVMSDETRRKISETAKGRKPRIGTVVSDETHRKMSEAAKGRVHSEETRKRMSEAKRGKARSPFTDETRKKMSDSAKKRKGAKSLEDV
jgi:group I intron endonuclease